MIPDANKPQRFPNQTAAQYRRILDNHTFRNRAPLPVIILAVDPGAESGYAIYDGVAGEFASYGTAEPMNAGGDALHRVVTVAKETARRYRRGGVRIYLATESWGTGGARGMKQWLGLAEMRGVWKYCFVEHTKIEKHDGTVMTWPESHVDVPMQSWRSKYIDATRYTTKTGKSRRFKPEEWKALSLTEARRAIDVFKVRDDMDHNAAEACLIAAYAARSDGLRERLSDTYLRKMNWNAW